MFEGVSREVSDTEGNPYPPEELNRLKTNVEQTSRRDPKLEQFLSNFDFEILGNIYKDYLVSFGLDPKNLNLIGKEAIDYFTIANAGTYDIAKNSIGLNSYSGDTFGRRLGVEGEVALTAILIHEETHATSKGKCIIEDISRSGYPLKDIKIKLKEASSGYSKFSKEDYGMSEYWFLINEGVTEKFSREVLRKYAEQSRKVSINDVDKYILGVEADHGYKIPVDFVNSLIARISEFSGFSEEQIWMALVQGMYRGEGFDDPEVGLLFKEQFGDEFLEKVKVATEDTLAGIIEDLKPKAETEKFKVWLDYFKSLLKRTK